MTVERSGCSMNYKQKGEGLATDLSICTQLLYCYSLSHSLLLLVLPRKSRVGHLHGFVFITMSTTGLLNNITTWTALLEVKCAYTNWELLSPWIWLQTMLHTHKFTLRYLLPSAYHHVPVPPPGSGVGMLGPQVSCSPASAKCSAGEFPLMLHCLHFPNEFLLWVKSCNASSLHPSEDVEGSTPFFRK